MQIKYTGQFLICDEEYSISMNIPSKYITNKMAIYILDNYDIKYIKFTDGCYNLSSYEKNYYMLGEEVHYIEINVVLNHEYEFYIIGDKRCLALLKLRL